MNDEPVYRTAPATPSLLIMDDLDISQGIQAMTQTDTDTGTDITT